jgi:hypothetical protein
MGGGVVMLRQGQGLTILSRRARQMVRAHTHLLGTHGRASSAAAALT